MRNFNPAVVAVVAAIVLALAIFLGFRAMNSGAAPPPPTTVSPGAPKD